MKSYFHFHELNGCTTLQNMIHVHFLPTSLYSVDVHFHNFANLTTKVSQITGLKEDDFYLLCNGKKFRYDTYFSNQIIHVVPRIRGGKGGFGSMLRAIGAQIEKTTNREACRDLSGRRLRDINEEKRLKIWLAQKEERVCEAEEKRKMKLERLCQEPAIELKDEAFIKQRLELTESICNSVELGLKVGCSSGIKRTSEGTVAKTVKKPRGLLDHFHDDTDEDSGGSDLETSGNSDQLIPRCGTKVQAVQTNF